MYTENIRDEKYLYCNEKANYEEMKKFWNIDWATSFSNMANIESNWEFLKKYLLEAIEKFVPKVKINDKQKCIKL